MAYTQPNPDSSPDARGSPKQRGRTKIVDNQLKTMAQVNWKIPLCQILKENSMCSDEMQYCLRGSREERGKQVCRTIQQTVMGDIFNVTKLKCSA